MLRFSTSCLLGQRSSLRTAVSRLSNASNAPAFIPAPGLMAPSRASSTTSAPAQNSGLLIPLCEDFVYPQESHYTQAPFPPTRHPWSPAAEQFCKQLEADGYTHLAYRHNDKSFVSGGHGAEHRIRYDFYVKRGKRAVDTPAPTPTAPDTAGAPKRPPLMTPADFTEDNSVILLAGVAHFGAQAEGNPGLVHGGALASLADSAFSMAVGSVLPSRSVTANLNVNYRNLVKTGEDVILRVSLPSCEGRKFNLNFAYFTTDGKETPLCDGTALFIKPRDW